ncbi:MAG: VOC family protein [Pseudomonadota bacterium]
MNTKTNELVPLLEVADIKQSVSFYVDALGFTMENEWRPDGVLRWCQVRLGGVAFMLQLPPHDKPVEGTRGAGVSFCVMCDDAIAFYDLLREKKVSVKEPIVGNALWVTSVTDPDGYSIDFESPTEVAEETRLSEWRD